MEKTKLAAVVPADLGWSDIGSWQALWQVLVFALPRGEQFADACDDWRGFHFAGELAQFGFNGVEVADLFKHGERTERCGLQCVGVFAPHVRPACGEFDAARALASAWL